MPAKPELRDFLRSRRVRMTPDAAGISPTLGSRRVPGLRREEVAQLAGVSADYYVRVEQGRTHGVSSDVLDAIARVLRLDEAERAPLRRSAPSSSSRRAGPSTGTPPAPPATSRRRSPSRP